jgi:capsular exopolysaccharide synthesis family protein
MDANQYLEALRKRWLMIVAFTVVGLLGGFVFASAQPVLYEATSSVYVASQGGNTTQEQLQGSTFAQNVVQSYVELATEPVVLKPVIEQLKLRQSPEQLAKDVSADLQVNTVIIRVTATDQVPRRAAQIANAITTSLSKSAQTLSATDKKPAIVMHRVADATPPTRSSSPNWPFLLASGFGIGLLLGLAYALGRQFLDTRVSSDEQVRSVPGLEKTPYLGSLSHRRGRNRPANVILAEPHGVSAEEYRRVITNLEFAGIDRRIRSITVTSALSGDGKSTTALNLATAAAERAQRVLLVDADLRRPSVAEYVGIDGGIGVTNVLLGSATPAEAIQRVGDVDVLPSGTLPPNVTQLVTSQSMARLLGELLMRYDFVVVDAPPLLPVIDALTFAKLTDGAIVVARQRVTRRKQFAMAIQSLLQVDAKVLGIVLNDVTRADAGYGYGYGYAPANPEDVHRAPATRDVAAGFFDDESRPVARQERAASRTFADR